HQYIDAAVPGQYCFDQRLNRATIGDIERPGFGAAPGASNGLDGCRRVISPRPSHHLRARARLHRRDPPARAARRARDDDNLLIQMEHAAMTASSSSGESKCVMRASE